MKREDYYQQPNNNESRTGYRRNDYQNPNPGPSYNNYNNYGQQPQPPYYPPRRHHVFLWIVVIILCLGLGWFAADYFMGGDTTSQPTTPPSSKVVNNKTVNNKTTNKPQQPQQQPNVGKLEREMNQLDVNTKDQQTAINFYQKQSLKNQEKMNKMIDLVNKTVPSNTLKRQALNWILR